MRVLTIKNGTTEYRDATPAEIAEMERLMAELPEPVPSPEERLTALEAENAQLKEALELLLSGVTEDE